ncbi:Uu.00g122830.m01.CDS01 [Anthostomella pinea]|uniref:Uu.00g122830.m01.CDS01 n=1 Tax=Anthostomella pinea TaxID=933095 RepID=A0AAI8YHF5_9PEZI|nr:Uu.00g122830.m01.CDS01 [Anthostomella pinea]
MSLASIHTTSSNTASFLFELCAHPEWFPILRDEIEEVGKQTGNASEVGIKREPAKSGTAAVYLKDETHIPKGCRIAFASTEHQMDPDVIPDPFTFDPKRSYRRRQESPAYHDRNLAALTDINNHLTFGYGSQAISDSFMVPDPLCPSSGSKNRLFAPLTCLGKFLGVAEINQLLSRLITEFDFKYPEGKSMPKTMCADKDVSMDPGAKLIMRKRKVT